jgi:hypothetical protein
MVLNNPFVKVKYILFLSVNNLVARYWLLVRSHPATSN